MNRISSELGGLLARVGNVWGHNSTSRELSSVNLVSISAVMTLSSVWSSILVGSQLIKSCGSVMARKSRLGTIRLLSGPVREMRAH